MSTLELPRWDTDSIYPGADSPELVQAVAAVTADLGALQSLFDEHDIRTGQARRATAADGAALDVVLPALDALLADNRRVSAYLMLLVTTDADDAVAAAALSRLQSATAPLGSLARRLEAWAARIGAADLIAVSDTAREHAFWLQRAARSAAHQMTEEQEDVAAELGLTGGVAWARLHGDVTARLEVDVPGTPPQRLPMAAVRGLANDPDAAVRRRAYTAELDAWATVATPLAAGLNAYKGEANVLNRRRGWTDSLDPALHENNVDRATLDAMNEAVVAALPDFARFGRAKARLLGHDGGLPWWDLMAPVGAVRRFAWDDATAAVGDAFATYGESLAQLAARADAERWVDVGPRPGKRDGGFCMPVGGDVSRILMNFDGSFDGVLTLAHELGHAFHNTRLADRTALQRRTPMALAETASIFCETLMLQSSLSAAGTDAERLGILDTDLTGARGVVVDIHSRFLFERALSAEREQGVLSADRMCELMADAQRAAYLDGVDHAHLHPYLWAVKGHYYTAYYNWPYTFGLLFGIGLHAQYVRDPEGFRGGYEDLLAATGLADAASLAGRFGIDITGSAFWSQSLDVLRLRIDEFCTLAGRLG
ncbi:hypothetical protein DSM112329_03584 [Paraconexibacter sp. AEG42_29]|uniref:Oligoendopeptidase F n=1 Tax=Paraconexibacter sp. AEG42_29 TaxID=2997339 RepID=A0AAU7AYK3_9ACTN